MSKILNKEDYSYYKRLYRANERNFKKRGEVTMIPDMMTNEEWIILHSTGMSNSNIVYREFHRYSRDTEKFIYDALKGSGIKVSKRQISKGNIPQEAWDYLRDEYNSYVRSGKSAEEAKLWISHIYFGSN